MVLLRRVVPAVLASVLGLAGAVVAGQQSATAASGPIIPRHSGNLIYCGLNLASGDTATITLTVIPHVAGTSTLRSYARITYTTDDTFAYSTITAS